MMGVQVPILGRAGAIGSAAKVWTGQLVDLSARNNLLFYRDLKVGTLDLGGIRPDLLTGLLGGRTIALSWMYPDPDGRAAAVKRARAVRNRAQEHFEERGLETLFVACGMATWTNQRGTPPPEAGTVSAARPAVSRADAPLPIRGTRPAVYRGRSITDYNQAQLRSIVRWIESDTLLRTQDELVDEVMRDLGFARHGKRIVDAIERAIASERRGR